jgi:hypothetical protein
MQYASEDLLPRATEAYEWPAASDFFHKNKAKWGVRKDGLNMPKFKYWHEFEEERKQDLKERGADYRVVAWELRLEDVKGAEKRDTEFEKGIKELREKGVGNKGVEKGPDLFAWW